LAEIHEYQSSRREKSQPETANLHKQGTGTARSTRACYGRKRLDLASPPRETNHDEDTNHAVETGRQKHEITSAIEGQKYQQRRTAATGQTENTIEEV
jgi:hypothetical protein